MQDMLVRKVKHAFSRGWKHVDQAPRKDFYPEPRIPLLPSMQRIEKMPKSIRPRFEGYLRAVAKKEEFLANLKASEQQQHSES